MHKVALRPLLSALSKQESATLFKTLEHVGLEKFFDFLKANRLEPLWQDYLSRNDHPAFFKSWMELQRQRAWQLAAQQLAEQKQLDIIHQLFESKSIDYFVFKGANLRETIYSDPNHRSSCDIDIFVRECNKLDAIRCLANNGYTLHMDKKNVSFEVSMVKESTHIDLHWYFLRQGRTRIDMSDYLFANRMQFGNALWGLNSTASLFVMLVHPVFSKHLVSPYSMLIHMVDLYRLLNDDSADWQEVVNVSNRSGMTTAAWSSLRLLYLCSDLDEIEALAKQIEPGYLRRKLVNHWIEHDMITRYFRTKLPIRSLFSLVLQDRFSDAVHAMIKLTQTSKQSTEQLEEIESAVANSNSRQT